MLEKNDAPLVTAGPRDAVCFRRPEIISILPGHQAELAVALKTCRTEIAAQARTKALCRGAVQALPLLDPNGNPSSDLFYQFESATSLCLATDQFKDGAEQGLIPPTLTAAMLDHAPAVRFASLSGKASGTMMASATAGFDSLSQRGSDPLRELGQAVAAASNLHLLQSLR